MSRIALVTGASRGIGRAIALSLAGEGHRVVVNYARNQEAAEGVVAAIESAGGQAIAVAADVSSEAAVAAMFSEISERMGAVEILINNAGITRDGILARMTSEDWDRVIEVNLRSLFLCTRAALRGMLRARWGRVISLGSVAGLSGSPGQANYSATKAAVVGFSKSLAKEVGSRGITVNVVAPGFIETDMTAELADGARQAAADASSVGRLGTPDEVASTVTYLTSEAAGFITGQVVVVDGGLTI